MKSTIRFFTISLLFLTASVAWSATDIEFLGPLNTWQDTAIPRNVIRPENFEVYPFTGSSLNDVAVPTYYRDNSVQGLDNLNQWENNTDNTYFTHGYLNTHDDSISPALQVIKGDFDANPIKDLVILHQDRRVVVCYNYTGSACSKQDVIHPFATVQDMAYEVYPWTGVVADFTGDGHDDFAVAGYSYMDAPYVGHLVVYTGSGDGVKPVFLESHNYNRGIPLSITTGHFDSDDKLDIATGTMTFGEFCSKTGAYIHYFKNKGNGFDAGPNIPESYFHLPIDQCYRPTGLVTYNPDSNGPDDLLLTCYDRIENTPVISAAGKCISTIKPGQVFSLKNVSGGMAFNVEQVLGDLGYPYSSTYGDYNQDSKLDIAVAEYDRHHIVTYEGTVPFQVDELSKHKIPTSPYHPKFIQTHEMNGDGLEDLVVTASSIFWPTPKKSNIEFNPVDPVLEVVVTNGTTLNTGLFGVLDLPTLQLGNDAAEADRVIRRTPEGYGVTFRPGRLGRALTPVGVIPSTVDSILPQLSVVPGTPRGTQGVLVLVNLNPSITIEDPSCETTQIKYQCKAANGLQLKDCIFESSDALLSATVAQPATPALSAKKVGTITYPQDQQIHQFTVKAIDENDKVTVSNFTIDLTECPGPTTQGTVCPESNKEVAVWTDSPFQICCPAGTISLTQKTGPQILLPDGKTFTQKNVSFDGQCISGSLDWDPATINWEDDVIELVCETNVKGQSLECPLKIIQKKAMLEGSGRFCSLSKEPGNTNTAGALMMSLLLGLAFLISWRTYTRVAIMK